MLFKLKTILTINAAATLPFAMVLFAFSHPITQLLNWPNEQWVLGMAIFLCFFSLGGYLSGVKQSILGAKVISCLDILWVIASLLIVLINPFMMSIFASFLVLVIAVFVIFCAYCQVSALQALARDGC